MSESTLQSKTLSKVQAALYGPTSIVVLSSLTQHQLDALRERTRRPLVWRQVVQAAVWLAFSVLLAVVLLSSFSIFENLVEGRINELVWTALAAGVAVYVLHTAKLAMFFAPVRVAMLLEPLGTQFEGCSRALRMANTHGPCKAYRDAVVGLGREFVVADLAVLESLYIRQPPSDMGSNADREKTACKELHGLPA